MERFTLFLFRYYPFLYFALLYLTFLLVSLSDDTDTGSSSSENFITKRFGHLIQRDFDVPIIEFGAANDQQQHERESLGNFILVVK